MGLIFIFGIPIGIYCARYKDTFLDRFSTSFVRVCRAHFLRRCRYDLFGST